MKIQGVRLQGTKLVPSGAAVVDSDTYFNLVTLLLPGNGTNGQTNNTFLDSSTNNLSITRNGNPTQGTFSPFSQTGWSNYFDGASDYLSLPSSANLALDTGDFTIEAWVYNSSTETLFPYIGNHPSGITQFGFLNSSNATTRALLGNLDYPSSNNSTLIKGSSGVDANQWAHVAYVRSSGTITLYLNGTSVGTVSNSSNSYTELRSIGATYSTYFAGLFFQWLGNISNLRFVKGTAVYTSAFTPSTTPLTAIANTSLLTCQSNRFVDNSDNNFVITVPGNINQQINNTSVQAFSPFDPTTSYSTSTVGGSGYFDGSGDWLTVVNSVLNYGTSNFSLEFWVYPTTQGPATYWWSDGTYYSLGYYSDAADQWRILLGTGGGNYDIFLNNNLTGTRRYQWNHIVLCRNGTTVSVFVNGTRVATNGSVSGSMTLTNNTYQLMSQGSSAAAGYMFGFRTVIGSYVYDATQTSITLPTAPPTAVSNTKFLCNFTNGGITDATAKNVLETVGSAQISTAQSKFGGSSMYFDGTDDYLTLTGNPTNFAFGTGDFTIEMWLYTNSVSNSVFYDGRPAGTNGAYPMLYFVSGVLLYWVNSADRITSGTAVLSTSTWYHIALCRSGTNTKLFLNGVQIGSTYTDSTNYLNTGNRPWIGVNASSTNTSYLNGYIDDLRITKGYARYTANFTPPTQAFPTQ